MISEVYDKIGGNYEDAQLRLMTDRLIEKFVLKFPNDPSFKELEAAMLAKDIETGFRAVHTLKGVAFNLSFEQLGKASNVLTDAMREPARDGYTWEQYEELFAQVKLEYDKVIVAIDAYQK